MEAAGRPAGPAGESAPTGARDNEQDAPADGPSASVSADSSEAGGSGGGNGGSGRVNESEGPPLAGGVAQPHAPPPAAAGVLRLRGVPFGATDEQVAEFFARAEGVPPPGEVYICRRNGARARAQPVTAPSAHPVRR